MKPLALSSLFTLAFVQQESPPPAEPPRGDAIDAVVAAHDKAVEVKLVSSEGDNELVDVVSHGAPAHEVLARLAQATGREFKLASIEAELSARGGQGVDVQLHERSLRDAAMWIAGAAGLLADVTRKEIRCTADLATGPDTLAPLEMVQRAIDGWRVALLRNPLQDDGPRLRFAIANALWQLGQWEPAIVAYEELEKLAPEFGDLPYAYFRCGDACAKVGKEAGAQTQWLHIAELAKGGPLVASARLEAVRSFRRVKDEQNATTVLRMVVQGTREALAPEDLVTAGELLDEGGNRERAIAALQWALQSTSDPVLEERALVALAHAQAGRSDWSGVIATAGRYSKLHADGKRAAEIYWMLARAHHELADPFTALLAVKHARELTPADDLSLRLDLLEGQIYAEAGLVKRAEPVLSRADACESPDVAAASLALHAQLLRDQGQFEAATHVLERLEKMTGHEIEAAIALAETFLLQHNFKRCLDKVESALARPDAAARLDDASRARLDALAAAALRETDAHHDLLDALVNPTEKSDGTDAH